ncbi:MAG: dTDP-4-dehydrorhamnose reductase [Deltaproteobacteria bacterium]|nr:dTDP-4-dehydrorhamnose reductase [Deltaproteobacteria bacterium]
MKILITGGAGQLGWDCTKVLEKSHDVTPVGSKALDIADRTAVNAFVAELKPDVILNCAAFTRVDDCETEKELAWKVNVEGPKHLASAAGARGARMIHISTDYVFDGKKPVPECYTENDDTHPVSYYGLTKLEAEKAVREETDRYSIIRTAWLYGANGQNFLKTMLRLALGDPEREIKVVHDQFGSPTWSYRLAEQIATLMDADVNGLFHVTSEGHCTWYELATTFLDEMEVSNAFAPCTTRDYPTSAERPSNSILENQRLKDEGLNIMRHWRADLIQFVNLFKDRLIEEVK